MGNKTGLGKGALYSRFVPEEVRAMYEEAGGTGLENEVRLARLTVARLLEKGDHEAVSKALLVVAKLVNEHRKANGDQASGIIAGLTQVLNEFGLGDGDFGREN